ncbi:MAG: thioredoxin family protein [Desulfobacterales bacterium]
MDVTIVATKTCRHCPILEKELKSMNIPYKIQYVEDHPETVKKFNVQHSPVVIVDDKVLFYGMPDLNEFRKIFKHSEK